MKYYCKNCGSIIEPGKNAFMQYSFAMLSNGKVCPICNHHGAEEIPDYETPQQYEKRTGKPWPDDALVWYWSYRIRRWMADSYICVKETGVYGYRYIVCAQSPVPPPDDWKPGDVSE